MANDKRRTIAGLLLALGLLLAAPGRAGAAVDEPITEAQGEARPVFAQQVTFELRAKASVEVTRVDLFFRAAGGVKTESQQVPFEQRGGTLTATYMHDLRFNPLPPFARIVFWWQIEYAGGSYRTPDWDFRYTDDRFAWRHLDDTESPVTVHWIEGHGDIAFAQTASDIARNSLQEINAELRVPLPESIDIFIYDAQHNLNAAMVLAGRDWMGGQAHPDLGVVVVAIPDDDFYTSRMNRYIPHEITHLLVYQATTPEGYPHVPEWLDEGLAVANERLPTPEYDLILEEARTQGRLIPLENLCVPFPPDAQTAYLSYAQSGSIVRFIRQQYGAPGVRALLAAYADGASCSSGVEQALNTNLRGLETEWRASLEPRAPWLVWAEQISPWLGLWLLSLLVALPAFGKLKRRR